MEGPELWRELGQQLRVDELAHPAEVADGAQQPAVEQQGSAGDEAGEELLGVVAPHGEGVAVPVGVEVDELRGHADDVRAREAARHQQVVDGVG